MNSTDTSTETVKCRRCRRPLTASASVGIGPRCAAIEAATEGLNARQAEKALELVADGGVTPTSHRGVYEVSSSDGASTYRTAVTGQCSCAYGLRRTSATAKTCYHVAAVALTVRPLARGKLAKAA